MFVNSERNDSSDIELGNATDLHPWEQLIGILYDGGMLKRDD